METGKHYENKKFPREARIVCGELAVIVYLPKCNFSRGKRKAVNNKWCVNCGNELETTWHIFMNCDFAKECWMEAGLSKEIEEAILQVESLKVLVLHIAETMQNQVAASFGVIFWQIWEERNAKLWTGRHRHPRNTVSEALSYLQEWTAWSSRPSAMLSPTRSEPCPSWHKPSAGFYKINVDAAFFKESNETGLGMAIHDDAGGFVAAKSKIILGCVDVEIGEALGFLEALSWVKQLRLERVFIEGDAKIIVDAIKSEVSLDTVFGNIFLECKNILVDNSEFFINFVNRSASYVAHAFARASRSFESSHCWIDPPSFVDGLPIIRCHCG